MANVSWCRQRMTFRWAYRKKEAVAAQGSNSAALGVMLGAGGGRVDFSSRLELLRDVDRCRRSWPADMAPGCAAGGEELGLAVSGAGDGGPSRSGGWEGAKEPEIERSRGRALGLCISSGNWQPLRLTLQPLESGKARVCDCAVWEGDACNRGWLCSAVRQDGLEEGETAFKIGS